MTLRGKKTGPNTYKCSVAGPGGTGTSKTTLSADGKTITVDGMMGSIASHARFRPREMSSVDTGGAVDPHRDVPWLPIGQPVADAGRGSGSPHRALLSNAHLATELGVGAKSLIATGPF